MSFRWVTGRALAALGFAVLMICARPVAAAVAATCGNGSQESGEQCDDGAENGGFNSCCASNCTFNGKSPDLIVGTLLAPTRFGSSGGINAYGIGTTSCNIGTCWVNWLYSITEHPVIGQNVFRLKAGRFEQIGQAWVKHGFEAVQEAACGSCPHPVPDSDEGNHLGVSCSDTYAASLNGWTSQLGPKSEVNPYTGVFNYPWNNDGTGSGPLFKRLQIHTADLDPTANPGALYFAEGQYVAPDDARAGHGANNNSWRRLTVGSAPNFDLSFSSSTATVQQSPAIQAWALNDSGVVESFVQPPADGVFVVSAKASALGGGIYHYEYAIQNVTSDRSGQSFSVPVPPGLTVTNIGFHDVDYHSGEPYGGTDWPGVYASAAVTWTTQSYATNVNANALRWGTLYNFRFDANGPPVSGTATLGLFKPGSPGSISVSTVVPRACAAVETACGDGIDDDCDGNVDCADSDCCTSAACAGFDSDGDSFAASCDCDDANASVYPGAPQLCDGINNDCLAPGWPAVPANELDLDGDGVRVCAGDCSDTVASSWATPGEVRDLRLSRAGGVTTLSWLPPLLPGSAAPRYDTIGSSTAGDFVTGATCVETNGSDTVSIDTTLDGPALTYYLVRAENDCPLGAGPLGEKSDHSQRTARSCP